MSKNLDRNLWPPPPPNRESKKERSTRLSQEADAKRKSESIDRQLKSEHEERQKRLSGVKVLLLGQAESGKTTVLKNFQLHFTPKAFELEAEVWRPVIQLNLVRSVNFLLTFISEWNQGILRDAYPHCQLTGASSSSFNSPRLRTLCLRLAPLRRLEEDFVRILSRQASEMQQSHNSVHAAINNGWKLATTIHRRGEESTAIERSEDGSNRRVLAALGDDIAALWHEESLQQTLKSVEITLEEQPGFFLDHAVRVTREGYKPKLDDVLKARMATSGPEAHTIIAEGFTGRDKQWTIYDIGGSCNQRAAWAQFFDDVNAIIFLAPMSGFNQFLSEDESVNRLGDSLKLWQAICSNKILASVELVLFLNKLDILDSKLKSGIQFSSFITSYVDKPNETKHVTQYLLQIFIAAHQHFSPKPRRLHCHLTCAVDTKATAIVINRIKELILLGHLSENNVL